MQVKPGMSAAHVMLAPRSYSACRRITTQERQRLDSQFRSPFPLGHLREPPIGLWEMPAAIRPCLFDVGAIDQISTFDPRYRPPGLNTASLKMQSTAARKGEKLRKEEKLTAVTMQPSNGLIEIDEPPSRLRVSAKA